MRRRVYLLALLVSVGGATYFGLRGEPVAAILTVVPGYLVFAYILILFSTFLPGDEKRRFEASRGAAFGAPPPRSTPSDTVMHPAYLGAVVSAAFSGDGFLGWPQGGDLVFRATSDPATFHYAPHSFRGFAVEAKAPEFLTDDDSLLTAAGGPVVRLEGDSSAMMVQIWFQPGDAASLVARLRAEGVKELG